MEIIKVILDNKLIQSPEDFKQYPLASIFITFSWNLIVIYLEIDCKKRENCDNNQLCEFLDDLKTSETWKL